MTCSKLESLPNEILLHLFENYINGVDIIVAFNHQLNQRITSLISQTTRMFFNFDGCRKDDFRFCIGLLPYYENKIETLILSDENAPGQVHAFLSFYPELNKFRRLRIFSLSYYTNGVDGKFIQRAIQSLGSTQIERLSIVNKCGVGNSYAPIITSDIFSLPSLTCLQVRLPIDQLPWMRNLNNMYYLQHLYMYEMEADFDVFERICQYGCHLKSLRMRIAHYTPLGSTSKQYYSLSIPPMTKLQTLKLAMRSCERVEFERLANCLKAMPNLSHLAIDAFHTLVDAEKWQNLIESSLPSLINFLLWVNATNMNRESHLFEVCLLQFQTDFWINRPKFNIIIAQDDRRLLGKINTCLSDYIEFPPITNDPIDCCKTIPKRTDQNDLTIIDRFKYLNLKAVHQNGMYHDRFVNVESLIVNIDDTMLNPKSIRSFDCSHVKCLVCPGTHISVASATLLFTSLKNLYKLQAEMHFLNNVKVSCPSVKYLDLSADLHPFSEKEMAKIARCFPFLERLKIRTKDLTEIHKITLHCRQLRCLEIWEEVDQSYSYLSLELQRLWDELRRQPGINIDQIPSARRIWIDHDTFKHLHLEGSSLQGHSPSDNRNNDPFGKNKNPVKRLLSFFRRPK